MLNLAANRAKCFWLNRQIPLNIFMSNRSLWRILFTTDFVFVKFVIFTSSHTSDEERVSIRVLKLLVVSFFRVRLQIHWKIAAAATKHTHKKGLIVFIRFADFQSVYMNFGHAICIYSLQCAKVKASCEENNECLPDNQIYTQSGMSKWEKIKF